MQSISPYCIARRLFKRKRHWLYGPPIIKIEKSSNDWAMVLFIFPDEILRYQIKLLDEDSLMKAANEAVKNYSNLIKIELEKEEERRNNSGLSRSSLRRLLSRK